ncbi:hypothetical protein EJ08DRAFT_614705 [Tothia fuscella]|uniref:Inclusion body clearance protein IML2 n=1 Tax=Tothia fuscella TaxID=1048955 RepID=A0A9P4NNW3_9PEZI|nr:hypothetical protein EJ08DRAFT_614705 [Tothia fuscella]
MFRSLLSRGNASTQSLSALEEPQALEDAMQAASYIMDDDLNKAEEELAKGNSAFHKLGKGVASFLRATLGFEREIMKEAAERLLEAESTAYDQQQKAIKHPSISASSIYSPGTEYALVLAQVQIMSAVIGVLTESVTESVKGFYKLRKAYMTLNSILEEEKRYLERTGQANTKPVESQSSFQDSSTSATEASTETSTLADDSDEFVDADESLETLETPEYLGHLSTDEPTAEMDKMTIKEKPAPLRRFSSTFYEGPGMDVFGDNVVDGFIHSGSNLCFGLILIMLSMLPPAFSTLSKIAGFKGDRVRGLAMLWQASKFTNINGAFAGLVLLGYYNGFVGFCDILPQHGRGAYPEARCKALLASFRKRYPKSRLWVLEEARMLAAERQLDKAMDILRSTDESLLKQVSALQWFERGLDLMYLHQYEECSAAFMKCVTLNNWSHALYYYIAGVAHVERYRELKTSDPGKAAEQAQKALEALKKVPEHTGKKKIMSKPFPFDVFVERKIKKWEHRAKEFNVDFIDAIGVSPIEEITYFWNGTKRMQPKDLEVSLQKLAWSTSEANPLWARETLDEHAILAVLTAAIYRNLGRRAEARSLLEREVLNHEWVEFKGGLKDNWTCPVAHYEMSVDYWNDYCESGSKEDLENTSRWLVKCAGWEAYDLDAR